MNYTEAENIIRDIYQGADLPARQITTVALLYAPLAEKDDGHLILCSLMNAFTCGMGEGIASTYDPIEFNEELATLLKGE